MPYEVGVAESIISAKEELMNREIKWLAQGDPQLLAEPRMESR